MKSQKQFLTIQQISENLEVPRPTLRFWEKEFEGILVPLRTKGGQRRYTAEHIFVVKEIRTLKKAGLSLSEIKRKLGDSNHGNNSGQEGIDLLAEKVAEVVKSEVLRFFERRGI